MPTQLDLDLERAFERHYAPGGLLETKLVPVERFGVEMPMLVQAPPALPQYLAYFSMQNAEKEFLVDGEVRLTFAQTYAAAREAAGGLVAGHGVQKGDFVGIALRPVTLHYVVPAPPGATPHRQYLALHGGLSRDELEIPLIVA